MEGNIPPEPGYRIPEMSGAAPERGDLRAMWIMGEDLLKTDPNTCHVKNALENLEFLVVQELFMTDTARIADVVFPASSFFEKEGDFSPMLKEGSRKYKGLRIRFGNKTRWRG